MSRRLLSVLILACMAMIGGTLAYTASATVPTLRSFAMLNGAQEAPGPGDANAKGAGARDRAAVHERGLHLDPVQPDRRYGERDPHPRRAAPALRARSSST